MSNRLGALPVRILLALVLIVFASGIACRPKSIAVQPATDTKAALPSVERVAPEQVDAAIQKAIAYLYAKQGDGRWDPPQSGNDPHWGTDTAVATYALLFAGESRSSAELKPAIEWLKQSQMEGTYALAFKAQIWSYLGATDAAARKAIVRDASLLMNGMRRNGIYQGRWSETINGNDYDNSASYLGLLGLSAVEQAGVEIPDSAFAAAEAHWRKEQRPGDGWAFLVTPKVRYEESVNMTSSGVASLSLTRRYLHAADGLFCRGNPSDSAIDRGIGWLDQHLPGDWRGRNVSPGDLFTVAQAGAATGLRTFGGCDWYERGARLLIDSQAADGSWNESYRPVANTALGILFLARGRAPIMISKLRYQTGDQAGRWNQRPGDVANAVEYLSRQAERPLNWSIVDFSTISGANAAPILYIAGSGPLQFTPDEQAKLKAFIVRGGMVLGHADCSGPAFAKSFAALGASLFPNLAFRNLPANHPIYTKQIFAARMMKNIPPLQGLADGDRELMLLIPDGDPGKAWQLNDRHAREGVFQLLANILIYARNPLGRVRMQNIFG